jgi:hypothetical protein
MIGQAAIGNPRIFTPHIPSAEEKAITIIKHLNLTIEGELRYQKMSEEHK